MWPVSTPQQKRLVSQWQLSTLLAGCEISISNTCTKGRAQRGRRDSDRMESQSWIPTVLKKARETSFKKYTPSRYKRGVDGQRVQHRSAQHTASRNQI